VHIEHDREVVDNVFELAEGATEREHVGQLTEHKIVKYGDRVADEVLASRISRPVQHHVQRFQVLMNLAKVLINRLTEAAQLCDGFVLFCGKAVIVDARKCG